MDRIHDMRTEIVSFFPSPDSVCTLCFRYKMSGLKPGLQCGPDGNLQHAGRAAARRIHIKNPQNPHFPSESKQHHKPDFNISILKWFTVSKVWRLILLLLVSSLHPPARLQPRGAAQWPVTAEGAEPDINIKVFQCFKCAGWSIDHLPSVLSSWSPVFIPACSTVSGRWLQRVQTADTGATAALHTPATAGRGNLRLRPGPGMLLCTAAATADTAAPGPR